MELYSKELEKMSSDNILPIIEEVKVEDTEIEETEPEKDAGQRTLF